eukprot:TRINITY_DN533_c0_g1_i1.p1 TRINITY_DN533_c0_g1~~TRINITY_DN533_c0_g1_i1.p1  ORF type:complete len:177 (-),score=11.80 TRINITY_DN533_c0_g1_i1:68-598(-)
MVNTRLLTLLCLLLVHCFALELRSDDTFSADSVVIENDLNISGDLSIGEVPFTQIAPPVGTVVSWMPHVPGASPPEGWMICDGSLVTLEGSLFNGQLLPDMRDRFLVGAATTAEAGTTRDAAPSHEHKITVPGHEHTLTHDHPPETITSSPSGAHRSEDTRLNSSHIPLSRMPSSA